MSSDDDGPLVGLPLWKSIRAEVLKLKGLRAAYPEIDRLNEREDDADS